MQILFATPEVSPFSNSGELGSTTRHLSAALKALGHQVSIITPLYKGVSIRENALAERLNTIEVKLDGKTRKFKIYEGRTPENVRVFFVSDPELFGRDPIYGPEPGKSYPDNDIRFGLFSRAICEFVRVNPIPFDVLHLHDWQTALAPVFLEERYAESPGLADIMVVQTIHDLSNQGTFSADVLKRIDLPNHLNHPDQLESLGKINYLKGGILFSDVITTVSPYYATELKGRRGAQHPAPELEDVFDERQEDIIGILGGVDYSLWDPRVDPLIPMRYEPQHLNGKRQSKSALQKHFKLPMRPHALLVALVSELDPNRKGTRHVLEAAEAFLEFEDLQFVVLGQGQPKHEKDFQDLARKHPRRMAVHIGESNALHHRIIAGADTLLLPLPSEPVGKAHLYAQRYATLPIAHRTGSFSDSIDNIDPTVASATDDDAASASGTGFLFSDLSAAGVTEAVRRAHTLFLRPRVWRQHQLAAMAKEYSWDRCAEAYADLYASLL